MDKIGDENDIKRTLIVFLESGFQMISYTMSFLSFPKLSNNLQNYGQLVSQFLIFFFKW